MSEIEAVFRRDLNDATKNGQSFYHYCRQQITRARKQKRKVAHVFANSYSYKEAHEASMLLTHVRNRFRAWVRMEMGYGGKPYIVIDLTKTERAEKKS